MREIQLQKDMKCRCNWDIWGRPVSGQPLVQLKMKRIKVVKPARLGDLGPPRVSRAPCRHGDMAWAGWVRVRQR